MGFGALRVINEDRVIPGAGFAPHAHENMDILTYVLSGALRHEDDQGNRAEIGAGEVQIMSAGQGITHSEMNASSDTPVHFLQIWLLPDQTGGAATYDQYTLPDSGDVMFASGKADMPAPLRLRSDTTIQLRRATAGQSTALDFKPDRLGFVHIVQGLAASGSERLSAGDGLQAKGTSIPPLEWKTDAEFLVFDMPRTAHQAKPTSPQAGVA